MVDKKPDRTTYPRVTEAYRAANTGDWAEILKQLKRVIADLEDGLDRKSQAQSGIAKSILILSGKLDRLAAAEYPAGDKRVKMLKHLLEVVRLIIDDLPPCVR